MFSLLFLFFIVPFIILFVIFTIMGVLFIPIIFLIMSAFALLIFSGLFYWIFAALLIVSLVYLITYIADSLFKKNENRKALKFIFILVLVVIAIGFVHRHFVHTEVVITNSSTGESETWHENIIN